MVEDETSITEPLAEALDREGFDTPVAGTVAEAIEQAGSEMPDLVLLDVDAARRLRLRRLPASSARAPGADHHAHRPRRGDGPHRRPRARRRRLHRQAVQRARGGGADPGGAAPQRRRPTAAPAERRARSRSATSRLDPDRTSARSTASELDLTRKEFELLALLMASAGARDHARAPDRRGLGHQLVRLHEDARRARQSASASKLGDDSGDAPLHPHRPRRRASGSPAPTS